MDKIIKHKNNKLIEYPLFDAGDIILTGGEAWISRMIRWATRSKKEKETIKNHVGVGVNSESYVEALWTTKRNKFDDLLSTNTNIEIWRNIKLSNEDKYRIKIKALEYVGAIYGPFKIILHFLDSILEKIFGKDIFIFRRLAFIKRFPICSWVVAFAYDRVGYNFGVDKRFATPDCIHDYLVKSDDWKIVYTNHEQYYTKEKMI